MSDELASAGEQRDDRDRPPLRDRRVQIGVAAYFISWAFLAGFIMMNIVLAILVDSFTEAQTALKLEQARASLC
jgi:hypothetical protein